MSSTKPDVRWVETFDRHGETIQVPDTTVTKVDTKPRQTQTTENK